MVWFSLGVLFTAFAIAFAISVRRIHALDGSLTETKRRAQERVEALCGFIEASRRSREAVLAALDRAVRSADAAVDAIAVFTPHLDELVCIFITGSRSEHYAGVHIRRDHKEHLIAAAGRSGHCELLTPGRRELLAARTQLPLIPSDRSAAAIPMCDNDALHAVVYIASCRSPFRDANVFVDLVENAAAPYLLALERERDRTSAAFDGLTGLLTPRAFRLRLHEEMKRAQMQPKSDLSIWFIDTDEFKRINDTLGHGTGDVVLQQMAAILRAHAVPDCDLAARNGGDEFCMLLRGTPKTRSIERAHAFCRAVQAYDFGTGISLSASVGVASYPYDGTSSKELLELADGAMYHSKRSGRNRVSFAVGPSRFEVYP